MFLRYGLFRITKILKNLFTAFLGAKKTPSLRSGMLKLFFLHSSISISQPPFFFLFLLFFFIFLIPHSFISPPHTATPRQQYEKYPSHTYIHIGSYLWKEKQRNLFLYNPWFPPKDIQSFLSHPLPFSQSEQKTSPQNTQKIFSSIFRGAHQK